MPRISETKMVESMTERHSLSAHQTAKPWRFHEVEIASSSIFLVLSPENREPETEIGSLSQRNKTNRANGDCSRGSRPVAEDEAMLQKFLVKFLTLFSVITVAAIGLNALRGSGSVGSAQSGTTQGSLQVVDASGK